HTYAHTVYIQTHTQTHKPKTTLNPTLIYPLPHSITLPKPSPRYTQAANYAGSGISTLSPTPPHTTTPHTHTHTNTTTHSPTHTHTHTHTRTHTHKSSYSWLVAQ